MLRPLRDAPAALLAAALLALSPGISGCQRIPTEDPTGEGSATTSTGGETATAAETDTNPDPTQGSQVNPEYRCDPADTNSCGDDEKCTALLRGQYQNLYDCVTNDGDRAPYDPCVPAPSTGQDGCPASTLCIPTGDESGGICAPLCVNAADCGSNGLCEPNPFNDVPLCADTCDPLFPLCPSILQCRRAGGAFGCLFATEVDIGEETAQCLTESDRGCAPGFLCEAGSLLPNCASPTGLCCSPICDLNAPNPDDACTAPATCNPALSDPSPGYEWVGACYIPA